MTLLVFVFIYIFGGLTFLPLLAAAILLPAWRVLPVVDSTTGSQEREFRSNAEDEKAKEALLASQEEKYAVESAASGASFAVLRNHDFQAANTALNARANASTGTGNAGSSDGAAESSGGSESVYQSMYRSVFDRNKPNASTSSVSAGEATNVGKKAPLASIFHIVLRHGHLMLYDSPAQTEVRHVISLAHYAISLSAGWQIDGIADSSEESDETMPDGELFIKRTAIVLSPNAAPEGLLQARREKSQPFFLFSSNCSEKEDFYQALLLARTQPPPPIPHTFHPNDAIKLQSMLHSASLTSETRALNALLGRIFLGVYQTERTKKWLWDKIEKKISRVQKPAFISSLAVQSIDLGDSAPVFSNMRLKDLNISGDTVVGLDIRYTGGIKITISAQAKLDLGQRFKVRTVDVVLASSVQRLQGHILLRIKPPPSNRIWFCFESVPELDIKVEPVVSQRRISYTFILRAIEERIRSVLGETLVKPNWDDVPFFDTCGQEVRGGIWENGGQVELQEENGDIGASLGKRSQKTKSMPTLPGMMAGDSDSSGPSSGSETTSKLATGSSPDLVSNIAVQAVKRRSVPTLPPRPTTASSTDKEEIPEQTNPRPFKPLRSPSFAAPAAAMPSVALNETAANSNLSRGDPTPLPPRRWGQQQSLQMAAKGAVEAMREVRDRSMQGHGQERPQLSSEVEAEQDNSQDDDEGVSAGHSRNSSRNVEEEPGSPLSSHSRTNSGISISTSDSPTNSRAQQQRKAVLTAAANATTAARNWGWNAIQNRTKAGREGSISSQQSEPVGRGQPLPPPGTPLPGPQKGWGLGLGSVKRKPLPAPRRAKMGTSSSDIVAAHAIGETEGAKHGEDSDDADTSVAPDEFGPWSQNSGPDEVSDGPTTVGGGEASMGDSSALHARPDESYSIDQKTPAREVKDGTSQPAKQKIPPPLPARRRASLVDRSSNDAAMQDVAPEPQVTTASTVTGLDDRGAEAHAAKNIHIDERGNTITDFAAAPAENPPRDQKEARFMRGADLQEADFEPHDEDVEEEVMAVPAPVEAEDSYGADNELPTAQKVDDAGVNAQDESSE